MAVSIQIRKGLCAIGAAIIDMQSTTHPCFLYARKSTDVEDKQVLSIEGQLTELREYAQRENLHILHEFIEKQSAKVPGRPVFNEMVSRVERGEASGIVSWHPDRLARNSVDGGKLIYLVDSGKIKALKFPTFWFEPSPQGKFMLAMSFGQSKYYVDSLSENTKRGLRQKVRRGEFPGIAPVGYVNDVRTKKIVVDKESALIIIEVFKLYSKNTSRLIDIAHFLGSKGIISRGNKPLSKDRVSFILSDPFYIGLFRYGGEVHVGNHEPLIPKKLFQKVQAVLRERSHPMSKTKTPKAFTGLLRCGTCNMMITAEIKSKFYSTTNHHATYTYYRCTRKSKVIPCDEPYIREEALSEQLSQLLETVSLRSSWANRMRRDIKVDALTSARSVRVIVAEKEVEIAKLTEKLQRLLDTYLDQDIDKDSYRKKKQQLLINKQTLEESIYTLQQSQNAWLEPMQTWISEASDAASVARGNNVIRKRELLRKAFGSNLTLTHQEARGSALEPWAALRAAPTSRNYVHLLNHVRTYFIKTT